MEKYCDDFWGWDEKKNTVLDQAIFIRLEKYFVKAQGHKNYPSKKPQCPK